MTLEELNILICDDSILFRKQMRDYLFSLGCKTLYEVSNGQDAIDLYQSKKPHIVFLDIVMPEKTGIEAVAEITNFDPDAYIIMFTSVGTQKHLKDAIKFGACEFLQKPFDEGAVKNVLEKFLHVKGGA